jgi:hypothetical protein
MIKAKKSIISNSQFTGMEEIQKSLKNEGENRLERNGSNISRNRLRSKDIESRFQENYHELSKSRNITLSRNYPIEPR